MLTIGRRVRHLRNLRGLSLDDLSQKTGIKKSSLSSYENDKYEPSAQSVITLCGYFNVSSDWLLMGKKYEERGSLPLTEIERDIIEKFRQLDYRDQEDVKAIIDMKYERMIKRGTSYPLPTGEKENGANDIA